MPAHSSVAHFGRQAKWAEQSWCGSDEAGALTCNMRGCCGWRKGGRLSEMIYNSAPQAGKTLSHTISRLASSLLTRIFLLVFTCALVITYLSLILHTVLSMLACICLSAAQSAYRSHLPFHYFTSMYYISNSSLLSLLASESIYHLHTGRLAEEKRRLRLSYRIHRCNKPSGDLEESPMMGGRVVGVDMVAQ